MKKETDKKQAYIKPEVGTRGRIEELAYEKPRLQVHGKIKEVVMTSITTVAP